MDKTTITLTKTKDTRNCFRFDEDDEGRTIRNVYLDKTVAAALGNPVAITVTIERADVPLDEV